MAEDLDKPLLDPENFNRDGVDLVGLVALRQPHFGIHSLQ